MALRRVLLACCSRLLLACCSALLLILAFPPFDVGFLAWVALVPLFFALKDQSLKFSFGLSFVAGFCFFAGIFHWILAVDAFKFADFVLAGLYLAPYIGLFGVAFAYLSRRPGLLPLVVSAPVVWVSIEYLRSHLGVFGFPWALLGHSQYLFLPVIQIADLTGVYGISFVLVMVNVALYEVIQHRARALTPALLTLVVVGMALGYGMAALAQRPDHPRVTITVVQGNVSPGLRWTSEARQRNLQTHLQLTHAAFERGPSALVIWPEVAVRSLTQDLSAERSLSALAKNTETALLIGSAVNPKYGSGAFRTQHRYNSAFLISSSGRMEGHYNKMRLVPFGEYLPFQQGFPWPQRYGTQSRFLPGKEFTIFDLNGDAFAVVICWEAIFPDVVRNFVRRGATFMVNITNEAWFGDTAAPYQFLAMNVFRAVENRRSIARSANSGISCFIDPSGRIIGRVEQDGKDIFVEGFLTRDIPLVQRETFYTLHGDVFAQAVVVIAILIVASAMWRGWKQRELRETR